jgi:hypothetical protein
VLFRLAGLDTTNVNARCEVVSGLRLFPHLKSFQNHVRYQCKDEEQQKHPRNALQRSDDRPVQLKYPSFLRQLQDSAALLCGSDILFQIPNPDTTGNTNDVRGKYDVPAPRDENIFGNQSLQDFIDWRTEDSRNDETGSEREQKIYDE